MGIIKLALVGHFGFLPNCAKKSILGIHNKQSIFYTPYGRRKCIIWRKLDKPQFKDTNRVMSQVAIKLPTIQSRKKSLENIICKISSSFALGMKLTGQWDSQKVQDVNYTSNVFYCFG